jgi:hypothetical protein
MPEQSRVEPGLSGPAPSNGPELAKAGLSAPAPKTTASEPVSIASLATKVAEPFKAFDLGKIDAAGQAGKLSAVSSRPKDAKAAGAKAEPQQQPAEKRRMSSIAPEMAKAVEPVKADASADMTKVETPRMPAGKVTVTPLGERAWEIKGLTPPRVPEAAKSAEQAKTEAPKTAAPKFSASGLVGKVLGFAAFAARPRVKAKGAAPKIEIVGKPEAGPKPDPAAAAAGIAAGLKKGKRRVPAIAAVVTVAAIAGAVGGALATSVMMRASGDAAASTSADPDLQASVTRIDGDVQTLKGNVEQIARAGQGLLNDTGVRLDRLEQQQTDISARFSRSGDASDRIQTMPQAATAMAAVPPATSRDTTGSVTQSAAPAQARATPKTEVGRLPVLEGWSLRDVSRGGAVIEGKHGFYEVYAGDPVPGLGRVDAIRKQDGRWVVVTTKGLIVSR